MNTRYYEDFLEFQRKGLRAKATESVRKFITSFADEDETALWVWNALPHLSYNGCGCVRHELFKHLISPVLVTGYEKKDFQSMLWLGKLMRNVEQDHKLFERIGFKSERELFKESHTLDPENREAIELLLDAQVRWLQYCQHEWPAGILYGNNGATIQQCREIRDELALARQIDGEARYSDFFDQFEEKLCQYESRLEKANPSRG
jgi:hypothetical protein